MVKSTPLGCPNRGGGLELRKVYWKLAYVHITNANRLRLLNIMDKDKSLFIPFRRWELYEYPALPVTTRQSWAVKTSSQLEKPCYVTLVFQIVRKNDVSKDDDKFYHYHCNVTNLRLFLKDKYAYDNVNFNLTLRKAVFPTARYVGLHVLNICT